jgi:hypothetical protein
MAFAQLPLEQRAAIVRAIKKAMWRKNDMKRTKLAQLIKRSEDCVHNALNERNPIATDQTITLIEEALGQTFLPSEGESAQTNTDASDALGGYSAKSVKGYIGEYVCIRPAFDRPQDLNVYLMDIVWKDIEGCLAFQEKERSDGRDPKSGRVYINKQGFMSLLMIDRGDVRQIILSELEDGVLAGLILTLSRIRGNAHIPVTAPLVVFKANGRRFELGRIEERNAIYKTYQELLLKAVEHGGDQILAPPLNALQRRPYASANNRA